MTLSIVWVVLAAAVTLLAMTRKASARSDRGEVQVKQSGKALTVAVIFFSMVMLAGFLYVSWQYGLELVK